MRIVGKRMTGPAGNPSCPRSALGTPVKQAPGNSPPRMAQEPILRPDPGSWAVIPGAAKPGVAGLGQAGPGWARQGRAKKEENFLPQGL